MPLDCVARVLRRSRRPCSISPSTAKRLVRHRNPDELAPLGRNPLPFACRSRGPRVALVRALSGLKCFNPFDRAVVFLGELAVGSLAHDQAAKPVGDKEESTQTYPKNFSVKVHQFPPNRSYDLFVACPRVLHSSTESRWLPRWASWLADDLRNPCRYFSYLLHLSIRSV